MSSLSQITLKEYAYWLALARAPQVGPVTFARLLKEFGSPSSVFAAGRLEWAALNIKGQLLAYLANPDWHTVENDLRWLEKDNNHLLTLQDKHYPLALRQIHDPPPILFTHGDYTLLSSAQLAIVGTRNPTSAGRDIAMEFAEYLSSTGLTITSGLALGIDAASHWGALAGSGLTVAVTGTGLDRVYPAQNRDLAHKIAETGVLVSELPPGTAAQKMNFPRRNRIISGLSLGVLMVEGALRSGALITARQAAEQGREVFAIPGSIHNSLTKGCHLLIKEGAKLIEKPSDIVEDLKFNLPLSKRTISSHTTPQPMHHSSSSNISDDLDDDYIELLEKMGNQPTSVDVLVDMTKFTAGDISSMLLILEMQGLIESLSGGLYQRMV